MSLPDHKTKIVATIGPASSSVETMERLIRAGMDVARLNFSHGDLAGHGQVIAGLRAAARTVGRRLAIMADLPGPKIRIGRLAQEPVTLVVGDSLTLTARDEVGDAWRVSVSLPELSQAVKPGDAVYLNDGVIVLEVVRTKGEDVTCRVVVGGELRSRKGLNIPGVDLGISAFTARDRECLAFAVEQGVDAVSQSFVASASDLHLLRSAAAASGHYPFVIAKIERAVALERLEEILAAADGIMVARGDLGVEIPIERIAVVQKQLIARANALGKPVITATQMLESMVEHSRPTRAEACDVANAILDGTDCVMLSEESAMGAYPVEAVAMLSRIAAVSEPHRLRAVPGGGLSTGGDDPEPSAVDLVALSVYRTFERAAPAAVIVPTLSGATARRVARFRLPAWVVAVSPSEATCQTLQFSWGVHPVLRAEPPASWNSFARDWLGAHGIGGALALLTEGPSPRNPDANNRMEIVDLGGHKS